MDLREIVTRARSGAAARPPHHPPAGTDHPLFHGLLATCASAQHWGIVTEGLMHLRYADGTEEVSRAGDVCHWPGGHTGWTDEGATFVEFSPAAELRPALEHPPPSWPRPDPPRTPIVPTAPTSTVGAVTAMTDGRPDTTRDA